MKAVLGIILLGVSLWVLAYAVEKESCNHAVQMMEIVDKHADRYASNEAYLQAYNKHLDFWMQECQ